MSPSKHFVKKKEDFVCEKCGFMVSGNGYTNHCPMCLWGKHVDINPGDRANLCGGLMEPLGIERKGKQERIISKCVKCGFIWRNRVSVADNMEKVIDISKKPVIC